MKVKEKYNIKDENTFYKHVNKTHKWSELTIVIIFVLYLLVFAYPQSFRFYYVMGAIAIFYSFRALMEWRYKKQSNNYRINILNAAFFLFLASIGKVSSLLY
ncbi:DUF4181 domain-containing protein [Tindallia californiensis]|uniref:DUF4181 domain-containing protein n=1 Tax=Tindallia californiensis TaxID=159292 RepID=UPI000B896780